MGNAVKEQIIIVNFRINVFVVANLIMNYQIQI